MGKKGKKGGKKKGGKKKKSAEPQMTWKEALLAYQISIKEGQIEEVKFELKGVDEKHKRNLDRNERLKREQQFYMQSLLKQAKEFEGFLQAEDKIDRYEVVEVMKDKWHSKEAEEKEIDELKEQISSLEEQIGKEKENVEYWTEYKDKGQNDHATQIKLLEQEMLDMEESFKEMTVYFESSLSRDKEEISEVTNAKLENQKIIASEKAMAKLDKHSRQEVIDNDWLKREMEIHKREVGIILQQVETLEKTNLSIMTELFECTADDLKISRNAFMTQFRDEEALDVDGILEMDLMKLNDYRLSLSSSGQYAVRPKSAKVQYIEDKVMSLEVAAPEGQEHDDEDGLSDCSDYEDGRPESAGDPFSSFHYFDNDDFDDYLKLGPLELKLLYIKGDPVSLNRVKTPTTEELQASRLRPANWPVTKPMIQRALHRKRTPELVAATGTLSLH